MAGTQRRGSLKAAVVIYLEPELLEQIDEAVTEYNGRSAWIAEACREKLKREGAWQPQHYTSK